MGSMCLGFKVILRRLSVLNTDQSEIRYATPLMTRSYAVIVRLSQYGVSLPIAIAAIVLALRLLC